MCTNISVGMRACCFEPAADASLTHAAPRDLLLRLPPLLAVTCSSPQAVADVVSGGTLRRCKAAGQGQQQR